MDPYAGFAPRSRAAIWNEFQDAGFQTTYAGGGHLPASPGTVSSPQFAPSSRYRTSYSGTPPAPQYGYSIRDASRQFAPWQPSSPQYGAPPESAYPSAYPSSDFGYDYIDEMYPDARVIEEHQGEPRLIDTRVVDEQWRIVRQPYIGIEKVLEVPQVIVKEIEKEVPYPEIVERIIEVPKIEYTETTRAAPTKYQLRTELVDVPQVAVEEHVRHVPRKEVQERLFEIPRVEFRENIEYEDRIEYREVLVDKIVEVPEVEYRIIPVEHWVPQTYVQEVDGTFSYKEVPMMQIQEVERHEYAQTLLPSQHMQKTPSGWKSGMGVLSGGNGNSYNSFSYLP
mmetsp:Transcript_12289/g.27919  ORF Transcript_12289/g.27919 Transcript_12289/m.27919 type:complete len:338 (-) Transcript_12289:57-1070(-)